LIAPRRAAERQHNQRGKHETWRSFAPRGGANDARKGFEALESVEESRLPPGAIVPRNAHRDGEIITYVHEGALAFRDPMGRSGVIHAGEFQTRSTRRGIRHSESNASRRDWVHIFQIWLRSAEARIDDGVAQKRFSVAERRGALCVVASPDARRASLRVHQDALVYSAVLERGQHVVHELTNGRSAWLHLVQGEVTLGDLVLTTGDGAGISAERSVSLTARQESEFLLLDLRAALP
jgi:quercetin 2,3-dioxygenase